MSAPERNSDSQLSKAFLDDTYRDVLGRFNRMKQQMSSSATVDDGDYDTALKCNRNGYTFEKITTTKIGRSKDDFVEETVVERSLVDGKDIKTTTKHIIKRQDRQGQVEIEVKRADPGQTAAAATDADSDYQSRTSTTYNNNFDETPISSTRRESQEYSSQYRDQFRSSQPMHAQQAYEKTAAGRRVRYSDVQEDDLSELNMTTPQNTPTTDFSEADDDDLMARRLLECCSCDNCAVYMQENLEACLGTDQRQDISCENVAYCLRKHKSKSERRRKHPRRRSCKEEGDNDNYLSDPLTQRQAHPRAAETNLNEEYRRSSDLSGHNLAPRQCQEPDNSDYLVTYPSNITNNALETSEEQRGRTADKRCPSEVIVATLCSKDCCDKKYPQATSTPTNSARHLNRQAAYQSELKDDVSPTNFINEERTSCSSILRQNQRSYSSQLIPPSRLSVSSRQTHNQCSVPSEAIDDISTPYQSVRQSWSDSSFNQKNYNRTQLDDYTHAYVSSTESLSQRNRSRMSQDEMIDDISAPSCLSVANKSKASEKSYPSERLTDVSAPSFLDVRSEQSYRQQAYPTECDGNILVRIYQNVDQPIRTRPRNGTNSPSFSADRSSARLDPNDHRTVGIFYSAEDHSNSGPNERRYPEKLPGEKGAGSPNRNDEAQECEIEGQSNSRSRRIQRGDDDKCLCACVARYFDDQTPTTSHGADNRARVKFTQNVEVNSITPIQSYASSTQSIPHQYRTAMRPRDQRLNEESLAKQRLDEIYRRSPCSLSEEDIQHICEPFFASESSKDATGNRSDRAKESRSSQTDIQNISEPIFESTDEDISEPDIHSTPKTSTEENIESVTPPSFANAESTRKTARDETPNQQKSQTRTNENIENITAPTFSSTKTYQSVSVQTSGDLSCLNDGVQTKQKTTPSQQPTSPQTKENIQDISAPTFESDKSVETSTPLKGILIHTDENIEDVTEPTLPSDKSADETKKTTDEKIQDITEPTLASSPHSSELALKYIPTEERVDKSFTSITSNQTAEDIENITEPTHETLPSSNKDKTEEYIQNITPLTFESDTTANKTDKSSPRNATSKTEENIQDISAPSFKTFDSKVAQSTPKKKPSAEKANKKTTFETTATKKMDEVTVETKRMTGSKEDNTVSAPTTSSDVQRLAEIVIPDNFDRDVVVILDERAVHETPPHSPERTPRTSETKRSIVITYKTISSTQQTSPNELTTNLSSELVRRVSKTAKTHFADATPDVARGGKYDKDGTAAEITAPSLNESSSWQPSSITPYSATSIELARQARGSEEANKFDDESVPDVSSWDLSNATIRSIHAKESTLKQDQQKKPETEATSPIPKPQLLELTESSDWRASKASSLSKFSSGDIQQASRPGYPAKTTSGQPTQQTTKKPDQASKTPADQNLSKTEIPATVKRKTSLKSTDRPTSSKDLIQGAQKSPDTELAAAKSRHQTKSSKYTSEVEQKPSKKSHLTTTMDSPSTSKRSEEADDKRADLILLVTDSTERSKEQPKSSFYSSEISSDWHAETSTTQYPRSSHYSNEVTTSSQFDDNGRAARPPQPTSASSTQPSSDRQRTSARKTVSSTTPPTQSSNWRPDSSMIMLIDSSNCVQDITPPDRRPSQASRQEETTRIFLQANSKAENRYDANLTCDQLIDLCIPKCFDREIEMAMGANDVLSSESSESESETSSSASFVDCPPIPRCFDQELPVCYIGAPRRTTCFTPSTRCINREQSNRASRSCERRQSTNVRCPEERRRLLRMQQECLKRCQERQ